MSKIDAITTAIQGNGFAKAVDGRLPPAIKRELDAKRFVATALSTVAKSAAIQNCSVESVVRCLLQCAQYGLELTTGPLAQAYLVPYGKECTLVVSWQGLLALARRGGEVLDITAECIRKGDTYEFRTGLDAAFWHKPDLEGADKDDDIIAAWCVTHYADGHKSLQMMNRTQIEKRRKASSSNTQAPSSPWTKWYPEMCLKTVIKYAAKKWPRSAADKALEQALKDEEDADVIYEAHLEKAGRAAAVVPAALPAHVAEDLSWMDEPDAESEAVEPKDELQKIADSGILAVHVPTETQPDIKAELRKKKTTRVEEPDPWKNEKYQGDA